MLLETSGSNIGGLLDSYPPADSPLRVERFFDRIYKRYDERFVFAAPIFEKRNVTPRAEWDDKSPLFGSSLIDQAHDVPELDYEPRVAGGD